MSIEEFNKFCEELLHKKERTAIDEFLRRKAGNDAVDRGDLYLPLDVWDITPDD